MRVILSHPYSGAIYWWFANQGGDIHPDQKSKKPRYGYYRTLYGDVDKNLDTALACAIVFDDIILPAADSFIPGGVSNLGMIGSCDPIHEAGKIASDLGSALLDDAEIERILRTVPHNARSQAIQYAVADILLAQEHNAPIICTLGRRALVQRLVELGIGGLSPLASEALLRLGVNASSGLQDYVTIVGLDVISRDTESLGRIKWNPDIRNYATKFQSVLFGVSEQAPIRDLYDAIGQAWESAEARRGLKGFFSATTRTLSVFGLIPAAGTVTGAAALASDAASSVTSRMEKKASWYELGPEMMRLERLDSLEAELKRRGHL
jgi:hypothetical protein